MSRINEIQERLNNATPGPWIAVGKDKNDGHEVVVVGEYTNGGEPDMWIDVVYSADEVADADFIARAPEDIRFLLGEVKRFEESLNRIEYLIRYTKAKRGNLTEVENTCFEIVKNILERSVGNEQNR